MDERPLDDFEKESHRLYNLTPKRVAIALLITFSGPLLYAFGTLFLFNGTFTEVLDVMSVSYLYFVPLAVGAITLLLSPKRRAKSWGYRILAPWGPIFVFFILTLLLAMEGWACWLMILPVFLIAASIGGILGGYLKSGDKDGRLQVSILALLPFALAPIEGLIETIPGTYSAYTYIDIEAPADKIWNEVTRVSAIEEGEVDYQIIKFLGFPQPVEAKLNYEGVGAYRAASFTGGLVFHETVKEYEHQRKMVFDIEANTHEIPSTTLDEHILIGGDYFDVLEGKYELEKLSDNKHRLHLTSTFKINTTFNFYAGWWGKWIMKDIQNGILKVEKRRAES